MDYSFWGMFFSAFTAATLLPAQSEIVLSALLVADEKPLWALIAVAATGNTLGSAVNWLLGVYIQRFRHFRWFPVKEAALEKAKGWYHKYGRWSLLLSWVPVIGDPLTLAAGVMREPFSSFILIVAIAKLARYLVVAGLVLQWFGPVHP